MKYVQPVHLVNIPKYTNDNVFQLCLLTAVANPFGEASQPNIFYQYVTKEDIYQIIYHSCRQGDSISPCIFVLCFEIFVCRIRHIMKWPTTASVSIKHTHANSDILKYSLFPRTIYEWNHLTDGKVSAETVETFKSQLKNSLSTCTPRFRCLHAKNGLSTYFNTDTEIFLLHRVEIPIYVLYMYYF